VKARGNHPRDTVRTARRFRSRGVLEAAESQEI
jgi:hypothetical protein